MQHKKIYWTFWLLFAVFLSAARAQPQQTTLGEIKKSLVCLCDCNMTVEACEGSMACDSAAQLTAEARQYVEQGMSKDAVLATFIKKYGEHILAAPTKKGFNLTAWILPFAAILIAGFGIVRVLRKWVRQQRAQKTKFAAGTEPEKNGKSPYEEKLDEVLHYLD